MDRRLERLVGRVAVFCVVLVLALASLTVAFGAKPGTNTSSMSTSSIAGPSKSLRAHGDIPVASDGNQWTQLQVPGPPARYAHAMAYDSRSDRVILFGGFEGSRSSNETWSYDENTNAWTRESPSTSPAGRFAHTMAYDAGSDRVILFGGNLGTPFAPGTIDGETWSYDFNNNTWSDLNPSTQPSPRQGAPMVYDSKADRFILFGGFDGTDRRDETWSYDHTANAWTDLQPTVRPPGVTGAGIMAYDSSSDRTILYGGNTGTATSSDTWSYDYNTNTWTKMHPAAHPAAEDGHRLAYDSGSDRIIFFGGYDPSTGYDTDATWSYDYSTATWKSLNPAVTPSARSFHGLVYDAQSNRIVLFGGDSGGFANQDTWTYDLGVNGWTNRDLVRGPSARIGHSIVYDSESDRAIMFGGLGSGLLSDTWAYDDDNKTWSDMRPARSPSARSWFGMAYDSRSDRSILFGGKTATGDSDETWSYDYVTNTWTNLRPVARPAAREAHAMAYDTRVDRTLLFGGYDGAGYTSETWSYDFQNNTWTNRNPAGILPARTLPSMAYDSESDRVILFGGLSDNPYGFLGDTWSYEFGANAWTNVSSAYGPSARQSAASAYDSRADRILLFGGDVLQGGKLGDTWAYDANQHTWTSQNPVLSPSARGYAAMAYDVQSNQTVLFGGAGGEFTDETWLYNYGPGIPAPFDVVATSDATSGTVPLAVAFQAIPSGGTAPYVFHWDFGDGTTSTTQNPTHTYQVAGTYTVTLTVSDADGRTTTKTIQITASSTATPPWILYALVPVVAVGIVALTLWLRRRRVRKPPSPPQSL